MTRRRNTDVKVGQAVFPVVPTRVFAGQSPFGQFQEVPVGVERVDLGSDEAGKYVVRFADAAVELCSQVLAMSHDTWLPLSELTRPTPRRL